MRLGDDDIDLFVATTLCYFFYDFDLGLFCFIYDILLSSFAYITYFYFKIICILLILYLMIHKTI